MSEDLCQGWTVVFSPPEVPRNDFVALHRHARDIVGGRITEIDQGFVNGLPSSLLEVEVETIVRSSGDVAASHSLYVVSPYAVFRIGDQTFCRKEPGYPYRPQVGDRVLLFPASAPIDEHDVLVWPEHEEVVAEKPDGGLVVARRLQGQEPFIGLGSLKSGSTGYALSLSEVERADHEPPRLWPNRSSRWTALCDNSRPRSRLFDFQRPHATQRRECAQPWRELCHQLPRRSSRPLEQSVRAQWRQSLSGVAHHCEQADDNWETEFEQDPCNDPNASMCECDPYWNCSPIILDIDRDGFRLTGLDDPVQFDIDADGIAETIAWTSAVEDDGLLALDRNGDGRISHGGELFGDSTLLTDGAEAPHGFAALAELDLPEAGGNGNGVIDAGDIVFPQLRVWFDRNHDGVSAPEELFGLSQLGVVRSELDFVESGRRRDRHGNRLRYNGKAWMASPSGRSEAAIACSDVYFQMADQ